jgi:hypothetical protein
MNFPSFHFITLTYTSYPHHNLLPYTSLHFTSLHFTAFFKDFDDFSGGNEENQYKTRDSRCPG